MGADSVHVGKDGWLFLSGGSNDVYGLFTDPNHISEKDRDTWNHLLTERCRAVSELGITYIHFVVPDKISVYPEKLDNWQVLDLPRYRFLTSPRSMSSNYNGVIDVLPAMLEAKVDRQLYWKTDTHWTYAGACVAHEVICRQLKAAVPDDLYSRPVDTMYLTLDLGGKLKPPVTELWGGARVAKNATITYKNAMVMFLELLAPRFQGEMHVGASVAYSNSSALCDPRKVLIFGDSYFEYRPHSLSGLFAETFKEVRFVWSNSLDLELVRQLQPDIVITEVAERFLKRLPDDTRDLTRTMYERIASFITARCGVPGGPVLKWQDVNKGQGL